MVFNWALGFLILFLPFLIGSVFRSRSLSMTYLAGQLLMWALFQLIAVPAVCLRTSFTLLFWVYTGMALITAVAGFLLRLKIRFEKPEISIFLMIAAAVILYQCSIYIFGMHIDEDDARWIAEANDALVKDKMYLFNPATGEYIGRFIGEMTKDVFSPWSMYLAWMSRITGIRAVVMAHTVYPPVLLVVSYLAYYEMGKQLFRGKAERGIFLLMVSIINLFLAGNDYTQSVFTLTRIWQGKAVVAAVVIPTVLMMILRIQNEDTIKNSLMLAMTGCAACLLSGIGIVIGLLMIAVYGLYVICCMAIRGIRDKEIRSGWKKIVIRASIWVLCMLPPIVYGLAYMNLKG